MLAKLLRSAMPMAVRPRSSAVATISWGCDAPRKKEKLVVTASSAYLVFGIMRIIRERTSVAALPKAARDKARSAGPFRLRRNNNRERVSNPDFATTHRRCAPGPPDAQPR